MVDKLHEYEGFAGRVHGVRDVIRERWGAWKEWRNGLNLDQGLDGLKHHLRGPPKLERTLEDYSYVYRKKTRAELVRVSAAVMGIEFSYAAETAFVSPTLLKIGVDHQHMTLVWALSPLVGFFVTPILGSMSDRCRLKYGRRRPFILLLALGVFIGLILVPNGEHIGYAFGDTPFRTNGTIPLGHRTTAKEAPEPVGRASSHSWGIFFTILGTVLLDFDADACQSPARAYLLDVTIPEDHAKGLSTFTIMAGLGGFMGYGLGGINWDATSLGVMLGGHLHVIFTLITIIFVICVICTITSFKEIPLELLERDQYRQVDEPKAPEEIQGTEDKREELREDHPRRDEDVRCARCRARDGSLKNGNMLEDARFDFSFDILEKIMLLENSNVFFSPYIIYNTLCLAYLGSRDTLEKTLQHILHIPDKFTKDNVMKILICEKIDREDEELKKSCTSKIADSTWITNEKLQATIYDSFLFDDYHFKMTNLHTNPADVKRTINKWVLDVTENIPDLLPQDSVSAENDYLVLVSAVRFKDVWDKSRFTNLGALAKLILSRLNFLPSNLCVQVISTKLNARIVEKPFSYGDVSIFKLIPVSSNTESPQTENVFYNPKIDEIMRLVRCLKTKKGSRELRRLMFEGIEAQEGMSNSEFQWFWMEERDIAMSYLFEILGVGKLLTGRQTDFSSFKRDGFHLSDVVHRAKITTDREGCYASASIANCSFCCNSVPVYKNPDFNIETPFIFLIYDRRRCNILFAGIMIEDAEDIANVSPRPKRRRLDKEQVPGKSTD